MSAVLLALFKDYETAERVRIDLVEDGFPTDRVELTACCELGRAACGPADTLHGKLLQYFSVLCSHPDEQQFPEHAADLIEHGAAAITVHPRGTIETRRAMEIFGRAYPLRFLQHDIANQRWEHAAAEHDTPWILHLLPLSKHKAHCIYCQLFERDFDEVPPSASPPS